MTIDPDRKRRVARVMAMIDLVVDPQMKLSVEEMREIARTVEQRRLALTRTTV